MSNRSIVQRYSGWIFVTPYLVLFSAFVLFPLGYGFVLSFLRWEMLSPAPPRFVGVENYTEAFTSDYFWKALWATFRFVLFTLPLTLGFALLAALGVNAVQGRRQALYRALYFVPTLITISVAGLLWRWFYHGDFGLFNAYLGLFGIRIPWLTSTTWAMASLVIMTLWWTLGGPMVILMAGLQQIPVVYYEAAAIDGAGPFRRFLNVTLPQLRPVLLFVTVMNIIGSFQVFGQAFMVTRGGPEFSTRVLVQYIYETAFTHYRMGYGSALCWLLFLCIAIFSLLQFFTMRER